MRRWIVIVVLVVVAVLVIVLRGACGGPTDLGDDGRRAPDGTRESASPPSRPAPPRAARPREEPTAPPDAAPDAPVSDASETGEPPREPSEGAHRSTGPFPEGEIPEEDRGKGECDLAIDLRDAATGRPHAGRARLWRLGVAADEKWPSGDHVQLTLDLNQRPAGILRDLPAGRYRLEVLSAAPGAEDPSEFQVEGAHTNVRVAITAPPMLPVRLRIFDETGEPILAAKATYRSPGGSSGAPFRGPAWSNPRNPAPEAFVEARAGAAAWLRASRREPSNSVTAGDDGAFVLGEVQGPGRDHSWSANWRLHVDGRTGVSVSANSGDPARGDFVALSVPAGRVEAVVDDVVRLPDGRRARAAGARIETWCRAVVSPDATDRAAARSLPIQVLVSVPGHELASFDWTPDGPLPEPVVMTPTPAK